MSGPPVRHQPTLDAVAAARAPCALAREAAVLAGLDLRFHDLDAGLDYRQLCGSVLILRADAGAVATHLLLTDLRSHAPGRIILVTKNLTIETRLLARLHGADHVLDATVDARELAAIIRNDLRITGQPDARPRAGEEEQSWHLRPERWSLIAPNDREVRLTRSEYALLELLIDHAGFVQPRPALRAVIQGDAGRVRVLDSVVSRLRRKVWDCAGLELPLRSARGEGYVFAGVTIPRPAPSARRTAATRR